MTNHKESASILEPLGRDAKEAMYQVLGSLDLLGDTQPSRAQSEHLNRCRAGIHGLLRVFEDVVMLHSDRPAETEAAPFSPAGSLRAIAELLEPLAEQRHLRLEVEPNPGVPTVEADAAAFEHIVTRLVEHAIRSVHSGPISLSIQHSVPDAQGSSTIRVAVGSPRWPIREDHITLLLAKAFAARIGATVKLVYADSGTRAEVSIPVKVSAPASAQAAEPPIRVLVAEDCDESFQLFSAFLQGEPCSISRAVDGEQAVAMATSGRHDIAFMDIRMPGLDGYSATQRIREWETAHCRKRMPIVVLSSDALEKQMREGAIVGCSGYLEKPVPKATLLRTLHQYAADLSR
jgi:CheY-like chemotaxis protein